MSEAVASLVAEVAVAMLIIGFLSGLAFCVGVRFLDFLLDLARPRFSKFFSKRITPRSNDYVGRGGGGV